MVDLLAISHACFMGINRNIYHLFLKKGWTVELVAPKTLNFPSGTKEAEAPGPDDPVIHFLMLKGENPRTYQFQGLLQLLESRKPKTILLDNDPVSRLALQVGSWCRINNAELFCVSNENLSLDILSSVKRRGWKSLPAAIVKRLLILKTRKVVHGVFTINTDGKKIFEAEDYKRVQRIPLGFDPKFFFIDEYSRKKLRQQLGLEKIVIAYFGRLTPEKGIHVLINALQTLMQHDWQLMMDHFDAYATDYSKNVHDLLRTAGISERVVYINPTHEEIGGYMNAADIVVVPSLSTPEWKEQYGRVAAEAMACGRVVIASDSGSLPELLGGHGFLFPEGDIAKLANLLIGVFNRPIRKSNGDVLSAEQISLYAHENLSIFKQREIMESCFKQPQQLSNTILR